MIFLRYFEEISTRKLFRLQILLSLWVHAICFSLKNISLCFLLPDFTRNHLISYTNGRFKWNKFKSNKIHIIPVLGITHLCDWYVKSLSLRKLKTLISWEQLRKSLLTLRDKTKTNQYNDRWSRYSTSEVVPI